MAREGRLGPDFSERNKHKGSQHHGYQKMITYVWTPMLGSVADGISMKVLKIGIASYEQIKARTMAIARGQLKPKPSDPKVWFPSTESLIRVLSDKNRALLATIRDNQPASLTDLAERTGRKKSNLSRTLKTMERYGIVTLERNDQGRVVPRVPYGVVTVDLPLEVGAAR
jgi:predicted transcriptional regulator